MKVRNRSTGKECRFDDIGIGDCFEWEGKTMICTDETDKNEDDAPWLCVDLETGTIWRVDGDAPVTKLNAKVVRP